jgi:hypothetical protein
MEYLKPTLVLAGQAASLVLGSEPGGSDNGNNDMVTHTLLFELGLDD